MHLVINNVSCLPKVNRIDDFVVAVIFIAIQIWGLAAVAGVVKEEGVVGPRVFDQPMHCTQYICFSWLTHGVLLVISQDDHILSLVAEPFIQERGHVLHIVDTTT